MTLALQLFKNSINTQEKLRLNLHSLSVCVSFYNTGVSPGFVVNCKTLILYLNH